MIAKKIIYYDDFLIKISPQLFQRPDNPEIMR
jgi:hypothetical protein